MKVVLKRNVKVEGGGLLHKNTDGILIAVSWTDTRSDQFYIEIKGLRYMVDKKDCDLY